MAGGEPGADPRPGYGYPSGDDLPQLPDQGGCGGARSHGEGTESFIEPGAHHRARHRKEDGFSDAPWAVRSPGLCGRCLSLLPQGPDQRGGPGAGPEDEWYLSAARAVGGRSVHRRDIGGDEKG